MSSMYAFCLAASTAAMRLAITSDSSSCFSAAPRFFLENHSPKRVVAQRRRHAEWASEFFKSGAITDGGSESTRAELVCASASERNKRSSQKKRANTIRIRPSEGTFIAVRQSRTSPTVTCAPVRSRNFSETSPRCHGCLAICSVMDLLEFDKIIASRKPRSNAMRRIRSNREMPHRSDSASGKSATINNGGREGSDMLGAESVLRSFVIHNTEIAPPNQLIHECQTHGSSRRSCRH